MSGLFVCAPQIQRGWHRFARTTHLAPYYSGVFFHGMDHGPSFEAVQSRSLRGYPLLHADRTGLQLNAVKNTFHREWVHGHRRALP